MDSSDGMWRDQYYIADLRDIARISGILERDQGLNFASKPCRDTNVPVAIRSYEEILRSPTSVSSRGIGLITFGLALPSNFATRESVDTSQGHGLSTRVTSPTTAAPASVSPASSASIASKPNVKQCLKCGQSFSGRPSDIKKNLERHIVTKHNQNVGVKCPQLDCRYTTTRPDNLRLHLKGPHKITDPQELARAIKKRKRENVMPEGA